MSVQTFFPVFTQFMEGIRAVFFDLGGVLLHTPFKAIADYEREVGYPLHSINKTIAKTAKQGSWERLERGELTVQQWIPLFDEEMKKQFTSSSDKNLDLVFSAKDLMSRIENQLEINKRMIKVLLLLKYVYRYPVVAVTNNWKHDHTQETDTHPLNHLFDAFIESYKVKKNKPDFEIFKFALKALNDKFKNQQQQQQFEFKDILFLDDIGRNLKAASQLGMQTVKIDETKLDSCLEQMEAKLNIELVHSTQRTKNINNKTRYYRWYKPQPILSWIDQVFEKQRDLEIQQNPDLLAWVPLHLDNNNNNNNNSIHITWIVLHSNLQITTHSQLFSSLDDDDNKSSSSTLNNKL